MITIQEQISLKDKNWFKTGGAARYFCEPNNAAEFQEAVQFGSSKNLNIFILGSGANIVISDAGFDGLVICPQNEPISVKHIQDGTVLVTACAGTTMDDLIEYTLNHNIVGLEDFSAIPGTIGGASYINLHYFDKLFEHFLVKAQVLEKATGAILTVDTAWFEYGYDQSKLMEGNHYLLNATLQLKQGSDLETAFARGRRAEITRHRISRYPNSNTCGSFFRNFKPDEVTLEVNGRKAIWIAYYLDKIGIKGALKVGGAAVSFQHANMLVTNAEATSADIIALARTMQELVKKEFDIIPQPECIFVGFDQYPLLK